MTEARKGDWCQLQSGRQFWPLDPHPDDFTIEDIAHGCAAEPRYGGHTREPYSVAQHSVLVSQQAERLAGQTFPRTPGNHGLMMHCTNIALWGLLHDASEGLGLKDIPTPLKRYLSEYLRIEKGVMRTICEKFHLPIEQPVEVTTADYEVFATEAHDLFPDKPTPWPGLEKAPPPVPGLTISPWPFNVAKRIFMERYWELRR